MNNSIGILADVLIVLGAISMLAGMLCKKYRRSQEHYRGRAEATVVEIVADEPDAKGKEMGIHDYYYPVFAYYAKGRLFRQRYLYGSNPCKFYMNQKVKIRYKNSDPSHFVLKEKNSMEQLSGLLHYAGLGLIAAGVIIFVLFANRKWLT